MKNLGKATIATDAIISFPRGTVVHIEQYEVGDSSENEDHLDKQWFEIHGPLYSATVFFGRGSSYSVDVADDEFEIIEQPQGINI